MATREWGGTARREGRRPRGAGGGRALPPGKGINTGPARRAGRPGALLCDGEAGGRSHPPGGCAARGCCSAARPSGAWAGAAEGLVARRPTVMGPGRSEPVKSPCARPPAVKLPSWERRDWPRARDLAWPRPHRPSLLSNPAKCLDTRFVRPAGAKEGGTGGGALRAPRRNGGGHRWHSAAQCDAPRRARRPAGRTKGRGCNHHNAGEWGNTIGAYAVVCDCVGRRRRRPARAGVK